MRVLTGTLTEAVSQGDTQSVCSETEKTFEPEGAMLNGMLT
jgi:hypothetical protein